MDNLNNYTSTGIKLIHHPWTIMRLQQLKRLNPISIQIAPTSACNLNCSFCSNKNRGKDEFLDWNMLKYQLRNLKRLGAMTVEWTGGGDPTLYPQINDAIQYANELGYQQGFITNGVKLKDKIYSGNLNMLHWLRISMNCLDYTGNIDIPDFKGTLGFSYVLNDKTPDNIFTRMEFYIETHKPAYVRIVPDCQATDEEQEENNRKYIDISKWGGPYFYQPKVFDKPSRCYWCYIKPFILHDGFVYRCSSVVLNPDADERFHEKYRWCSINELTVKYQEEVVPFYPRDCSHCVFTEQNNLIDSLVNLTGHENFV